MRIVHMVKVGDVPIERSLLYQALSFFGGASRCIADISITPEVTNCAMTPAIVCYAFSCELYLKLLNAISTGNAPRGHKLDELFDLLPQDTKAALAEVYGSSELAGELRSASSAFTDWRYQHEHETLTIRADVLVKLATSCHRLAMKLRPDLGPREEQSDDELFRDQV